MPVATLIKAASYQSMLMKNRPFKFEVPQDVTQEEVEILRPSGYFKFTDEAVSAPADAEPIEKPKGGVKIIKKGAPIEDEGVTI